MIDAETPPAFVLGFDGVPWNLIERWVDEGELPAFARLFESGTTGPLKSTTPASTPLAWPSIATGRRPDGHGSYWFRTIGSDYSHSVTMSHDIGGPFAWDLLAPASVANVPMTYPARPMDGYMVTGMMTPHKREGFTHPPELAETLAERVPDYRIGLDWESYDGDKREFAAEIDDVVDGRERLLEYLLAETEFRLGFVVFTAPDRLQHLVWDEDVLLEHYRRLDEVLATVRSYVEARDGTLFVVSDHGFGPAERIVSANRALEREGLLSRRTDEGTRGVLGRLGVTKSTVRGWLDRVGIDDATIVESVPQGLVDMVAMQVPGTNAVYDIEYGESLAFVRGAGSVYLNRSDRFEDGTVDPDEVPELKSRVRACLESVADPETGERVLEVFDGDELFPTDDSSPELVVEAEPGYLVQTPLADEVVVDAQSTAAGHRPEGIFLATGPDVAAGRRIDGATVFDVLPTLLHALGEPVPTTVDGEVIDSVFADGSEPAVTEPTVRPYEGADRERRAPPGERAATNGAEADDKTPDAVEERLRGLGYIDD
ncbi:alkaline phosphatase family protein [Halobaculum rubrum]|nr:alkaline phosphatase family protein [Halobaculum rubrum]